MKNENPIRILHVVQRMESAGLQSFIMNVYRKIDRSKIQFDFLVHYTERQFYDNEIEKLGGKIYRLSFREDKNIIKYVKDLDSFFKQHAEDYLVVHGHMDSLGFIYLFYAKKYNVKIRIAHAHTYIKDYSFKKILRRITNKMFKINATKLLACSELAGDSMFGNSSYSVIKNPVDSNRFKYDDDLREKIRKELGLLDCFVIGNVGRLSKVKNQKFVIDIFKECLNYNSNSRLLLIGSGELENELKAYVSSLNLSDSVFFLEATSKIEDYYQSMDAFVFPSLYEGLGIVCIEAQACGLPTFASDRIPATVKITDNFFQISLKKKAEEWASIIMNNSKEVNRCDKSSSIKAYGYDIESIMKQLLQAYEVENDE